jgi:tetratricopeptide (TPR) repeat protein
MRSWRAVVVFGCVLLALTACGDSTEKASPESAGLVVDYPLDGSVFPPEFVPPTFLWHDLNEEAESWQVDIAFADGEPGLSIRVPGGPPPKGRIDPETIRENNEIYEGTEYQRSAESWTPPEEVWAEFKRRSVEAPATITITGWRKNDTKTELSRGAVRISTSKAPVGAPIFYRDVPLMPAVGKQGKIQPLAPEAVALINWRLRDLSKPESHVVLKDMPSCANCHSFSDDGKTMGMDVDGPDGDKGAYMIAPVGGDMTVTDEEVITWNAFKDKPEGHRTIGFLSRVSPDGKHVLTTLNEALFVTNFTNYKFLQVFFPTRGILGWYSSETGEMKALPGADDTEYVHCSPVWTPDGEWIVFSRAKAFDPYGNPGQERPQYANDPREPEIRYDLYRMPFNGGKGGKPVPIEGASANGMSNTFPKVSPDGKWLVWTRCRNGLLMRPDGRLWIVPLTGGEPREMNCNTPLMNSWHSFSPNGRWMVFSSKSRTPYTQMFLTHIDENGNDTPAILVPNSTAANRAVNIPEFLNAAPDAIRSIHVPAVSHYRLFNRAKALLRSGQFEDAIPLAKKSLEEAPDFVRARVLLGWALFRSGRADEGIAEFQQALREDPRNAEGHLHLGLALRERGLKDPALRCFELAVKYGPGNAEAWKSLGLAELEEGNYTRALKAYENARRVSPEDPSVHESIAVVLVRQGEVAKALPHLETACALDAEDFQTRMFLALHYAASRDPEIRNADKAIRYATETVKLTKGENPAALDAMAAAYAEAGRWSEAVETAKKAHSLAKERGLRAAERIEERLRLYEQKKPYRQKARR